MSDNTGIEWTDATWNPTTGCDRVSPGCDHCYALTMAKRLKGMGSAHYQTDGNPTTSGPGFGIAMHPDALEKPLHWAKPKRIFVNSMSDLFHDGISDDFIARVWAVMAATSQHTYQVLTKRHARMRSLLNSEDFEVAVDMHARELGLDGYFGLPLRNVWLGVSVENQQWADIRIPALLETPAAVRFLSCEPLLGPVDLFYVRQGLHAAFRIPLIDADSLGVDWVIAGGESGDGARPMHPEWVRSLLDQCQAAKIPFLFKQWGDWGHATGERQDGDLRLHPLDGDTRTYYLMRRVGKKAAGRELGGRTWDEYPQAVTS